MPSLTCPSSRLLSLWPVWCVLCLLLANTNGRTQATATAVPLILPGGLAFDSSGNLYFAETGRHVVRKMSAGGGLAIVAGTGVQGFGGDGGLASAALLDSPADVALDAAGDLFIADAHNHRVRRVDAVSGMISTVVGPADTDLPGAIAVNRVGDLFFADTRRNVIRLLDHGTGALTTLAGSGVQGYGGDGGPPVAAQIDSPGGLTVDAGGDVFLSDSHNQRVRRVDAVTGIITTVTGTGIPGFGGDGGAATAGAVRLPRGLALDGSGNLFIVDARNERIRRVDAATGVITTVAGVGAEGFAGDGLAAVAGTLDSPRSVAVADGLPVFSDSRNGRLRGVDAAVDIYTLAGLGANGVAGSSLTISGSTVATYGTGGVMATLAGSPAGGTVTFFDGLTAVGSAALSANAATISLGALAAGVHRLSATYAGDATHSSAQSGVFAMTIAPAALTATPTGVSLAYGQAMPALTGTLSGLLKQDAGLVTLALTSAAGTLSAPGSYAIAGTIAGASAGNYALTVTPAVVIISKTTASVTLSGSGTAGFEVHVAPAYAGVATGSVTLMDGSAVYATTVLSASGDAAFSGAALSAGTHTLTAVYAGDGDFLANSSAALVVTVGAAAVGDFSLTATGATAVTVVGGNAAQFSFNVAAVNGGLSSPVQMTVTGLPVGATALFNPVYVPPASASTNVVLMVQTIKLASLSRKCLLVYAGLLAVLIVGRRRRLLRGVVALGLLGIVAGCGDRVTPAPQGAGASATYNVTVVGTGTAANGAVVQHSVGVTLTVY